MSASAARELARKDGVRWIELDTWAFNGGAHEFFRAAGFELLCYRMAAAVQPTAS